VRFSPASGDATPMAFEVRCHLISNFSKIAIASEGEALTLPGILDAKMIAQQISNTLLLTDLSHLAKNGS
jgi:hypothetical protein